MFIVGVAALIGVCTIVVVEHHRDDLLNRLEQNIDFLIDNAGVVVLAAFAMVSPVLAAGGYLFVLGTRIVRSQRFPPPNQAVVRDTRVLEGTAAVRRGRIVQLLSLLLSVAAGAIPLVLWRLLRMLGDTG
jgi:hypothetical protein